VKNGVMGSICEAGKVLDCRLGAHLVKCTLILEINGCSLSEKLHLLFCINMFDIVYLPNTI